MKNEESLIHKFLRLGGRIDLEYTVTEDMLATSDDLSNISDIRTIDDLLNDENVLNNAEMSDSDVTSTSVALTSSNGKVLCEDAAASDIDLILSNYFEED